MKFKYDLIRTICTYSNFTIFLISIINTLISLFDLGICKNTGLCQFSDILFSILRFISHLILSYSMYIGFYGLSLLNRNLIKYHINGYFIAFLGATIALIGYLTMGIPLIHYVGVNHINSTLIGMIDPVKNKLDQSYRFVHSIQIYYQCCGWESYSEWNTTLSGSWPSSCCLSRFTNQFGDGNFTCFSESFNFHHKPCKIAMNSYVYHANRFYRASLFVITTVTLFTIPLTLYFMKKVSPTSRKYSFFYFSSFINFLIRSTNKLKRIRIRIRTR